MPEVVSHLSLAALQEHFAACRDARTARQMQAIWLLAQGHSFQDAAATTVFSDRWVRRLLERYNAGGPDALGDRRRTNGRPATVLTPAALAQLRARREASSATGEIWTSRKAAAVLAEAVGREQVGVARGWEALRALRLSRQQPRPRHPRAATPEDAAAFQKKSGDGHRRRGGAPARLAGAGVCQ